VNAQRLNDAVEEVANVADIGAELAHSLSSRLPEALRVYGGAVRIFWPNAERDDVYEHPLFVTRSYDDSAKTISKIIAALKLRGYHVDVTPASAPWNDPHSPTVQTEAATPSAETMAAHERAHDLAVENTALKKQVKGLSDQVTELTGR